MWMILVAAEATRARTECANPLVGFVHRSSFHTYIYGYTYMCVAIRRLNNRPAFN